MVPRSPSRHLPFHQLVDALHKTGCPVCRLADEAATRWLRALFHEQVNDVATRRLLREGGAFCRRHTQLALELGDALGSSILYADLLRHAWSSLATGASRRCLLCEREAEAARAALTTLHEHISAADVRALYEASDGLCLTHLQEALRQAKGPSCDLLLAIEQKRMTTLVSDCQGFITKSDYRDHRPLTQGERDAWRRAARKLGGGYEDRKG